MQEKTAFNMSVSKEKALFFLSGNRNKTIKQMLLKDATPEKLLRRFQEFGLAAEPDMLEEVESHMTVFHPGDSKTVFEDLESDGVYEIPFHGNAKAPENKEAACGQPNETLAPSITRPPDILDEDIHRALICCAAVYGPDEELVRSHFDENRQVHNFERFSLSRYGKVRYFIAVRQGSKGNRTEVFISFRGTDNFDEILADMQEVSLCSDFEGKIHAGFYELAATIPVTCILQKYQNAKIVVCGHSLGGAVAKIVALHMLIQLKESKTIVKANPQSPREDAPMPLSCITFGAPYVADRGVSEYIEKYGMTNSFLNVINQNDPVPYVFCLAQASQNKPTSKPHSSGVKRALSPILNLIAISSGACTANLGDGIADDLAETNKLLQSTQRSEEVYCALGWYLFYTHSESSDPAWNAEFVFDQTMVNRKLSRIGKVTGETIEQHTMKNYNLAINHEKSIQQPNYNPTSIRIGLTNDFLLKVNSVGLQMEKDTSPGINELNVTIKGENLSFFTLDGSEFTGVPKTLGEIEVYECSKNRVGMMFLVDSESSFDSNLRFKICGHFNEDKTTVSNREIQKIKSMTPAELLYKDMNPKMLHKAFERGIAEMAMQPTQEKRDHEQAENPFLKNLYKLEMTADSKYEGSFASCQLFEIAGRAAGKGKMCMSKADSEKAQQVMKTIVEKMSSPLKIQVEWKWYEYITAAVLGLAGVAAITATGGGAAIVIGGACANLGLTVGISGSIGTIATGALNYLYYRKANYEDNNYKVILRTCIEELPDLTDQEMNKLVKGGADSQHVITLEETLLRKCYNLDYMYQDRKRSSLEWRDIDGILGSLPFENSTKFRRATKDSQKLIFQHIQMCINLYELRQKLIESCFVCIAGLQDSGKSTLIKQVWGQDVQDIGFQIHTKEAVLHRITSKMTVIDFPGTSDLEQDVADTLATCGTVASLFVYVMPFSGDPSQIHVKEMQGIVPFNCPVLVCINQCSRYLDAFKDKAETEAFEKKYHDVILKTFKEKAETAEDIPEFKLMFTDFLVFDEEMEKRGLKGTDHVRAQIKEWLKKFGVYGECEDLEIAAGIGQKAEETQGAVGFDATPTEEELELVSGISDCKLAEPVQEVGDSSFDIPIDEKLK